MVAAVECALPPPDTGHFLEVSFRRLLRECQGIANGTDNSNPKFVNWAESPLFHHHVATLEEQLQELRAVPGHGLSASTAQAYDSAVARLKAQLRDRSPPGPTSERPADRDDGDRRAPEPHRPTLARTELLAGPRGGEERERLDAASRHVLASQGLAQEALTDELAVLAASLKVNTQAMERKVQDRGRLLDDTETAMDKSVYGVRTAHAGARTIHRKRRLGFCFTLLALILIVTAFVGMYIFIKLTSLAGYRAASRAISASPAAGWARPTEL